MSELTREELLEITERRRVDRDPKRWTNGNDPSTWRPYERCLSPLEQAIARKLSTDPLQAEPTAWDMPEIPKSEQ